MSVKDFVQQRRDDFIALRRDFHMYPEPAWLEYRSAAKVAEKLIALGYDVALGAEVLDLDSRMGLPSEDVMKAAMARAMDEGADPELVEKMGYGKTAIVATMKFSDDGPVVAFRADMDSNDVIESKASNHTPAKNGFRSRHEKAMHACGHDMHMTTALGLLDQLVQVQPKNKLLFLFQPAEENEAGGMLMYKDNAFGDWLPDEFYGLHVRPDLKVGDIATNTGTLFAGTCEVKITFTGKGGHAAFPHEANDALVAASYFITQVQSVVSRNVDPIEGAVVTFGSMHAGTTNNVIAETAFLHGTIRTLTMEMTLLTQKRVKAIAEGVAAAFDVKLDLELK